jgi:hypothetical protein
VVIHLPVDILLRVDILLLVVIRRAVILLHITDKSMTQPVRQLLA